MALIHVQLISTRVMSLMSDAAAFGPLTYLYLRQMKTVPRAAGGGRVVRRCWVNFQCRGVVQIWIIVGQGPVALAVGVGGGLFGHFFCSSVTSLFFLPLSGRRPDID